MILDIKCNAFAAPEKGALTYSESTFSGGDTQTITCNAGFGATGPTMFACTNLNANSAEWQPAHGLTTCGKVHFIFVRIFC